MELSFTADDIEKWAVFSGDRNPIHFDIEAAARLGVDKVVTHGMLALLQVKQTAVSKFVADNGGWTQFKTSLKAPILCDDKVTMSETERRNKLCFKVNSVASSNLHLVGSVSSVEQTPWQSQEKVHHLNASDVEEKFRSFYQSFDSGFDAWVWVDALVFGHFISNQISYIMSSLNHNEGPDEANCLTELAQHTVVQISHLTRICPSLQSSKYTVDSLPSVAYQIDNMSLTEEEESAFGVLELAVFLNGQHEMTIELGLLIKFNN
ncbi:hypothetical protein L1285_12275 [Pseudoalteromonas sp. DL2-H2.2]|uniref:MaoC/PaaZ C-terminal domain-containing protein n=1 Tax=Pseudoalteromonas sp. DL2-H2.2 TaxID=2908889 RepID=UPI001F3D7A22|nr:MaoC/PaaZ C-terminal domain-containing protein [Pseudoalteromonas sp. DL2-H2.2]MCF2909096.1 hypothetical protein [Pseudoalteromonas sp. DL2-H2.2]